MRKINQWNKKKFIDILEIKIIIYENTHNKSDNFLNCCENVMYMYYIVIIF